MMKTFSSADQKSITDVHIAALMNGTASGTDRNASSGGIVA